MKKIIIPISMLFLAGLSHAQTTVPSTTENYVYTKTYITDPTAANPKTAETVQYMDGLGRPKQVVNIKASPLGRDVVSHIEYDGFGRQVKDYLPVPQSGTMNGAIVPTPLSNATQTDIYGSEKIYAEKILENSPLDRVQQQIQVGNDWTSKPIKFDYDANVASDYVRKYETTTTWVEGRTQTAVQLLQYFQPSQLYKNTVTDEDGNKTIEFKNGQGQTLLLRKVLSATENTDTYYVYNEYNQLAFVIPPLASAPTVESSTVENLYYQYRYDGRNRLVEKKLPGKGWEYMVYDKADRLVATQDANLRQTSKWVVTKYDTFGRVIYTGLMPLPNQTRAGLQNITNQYVITESRNNTGFTRNGMQIYYTNDLYNQIETILTVNYYDIYPVGSPAIPTQVLGQNILHENAQLYNISTKTLPVASYVKNIEDDNWTKSYTWYDTKGRPVASHSVNHLGGYTKTESLLDFSGVPKQAITKHKRLDSDTERVITENFTYDHQNRLLTHTHQVDSNPLEYLAQNDYNELSQLKNKKVGGASLGSGIQTVDYAYNIRGWMTQINDPANLNGKLFGYQIKYHNPVYTNNATGRYNGNIAEVDWKSANDGVLKRYSYQYDALNRLKKGSYAEPDTSVPQNGYFNEELSYDLNGNIGTLKRNRNAAYVGAELIDDLTYNYTGNRLNSVADASSNYLGYPDTSGNLINYDFNGNMKDHVDKGILQIDYNFLNLPNYIKFDQFITRFWEDIYKNTLYTYRADGTKIKKTHTYFSGKTQAVIIKKTDYLDGFQYIDNIIQFVPTSEGYFDFVKNKYIYNYTDHLGNTRLSYLHNGSSIGVLEENIYYPFGLKHDGYNPGENPNYQYEYNGKELQAETGMYDYGARMYMPDIGRWGVIDPLAEKHRRHSPYNYAVNNPIIFTDPDGRDIRFGDHIYTYDKKRDYSKYNDFDANVFKALDHLYSSGALNVTIGEGKEAKTVNIMDEMINDKKNTFTILEQTKNGEPNEYNPNLNSVKFNTSEGVRFRKDGAKSTREPGNLGYNSPTSRLGHEIIHGWGDLLDTSNYGKRRLNDYAGKKEKNIFNPEGLNIGFKNEEEEFTTVKLGNQMNKKLGEDYRTNYSIIPYPVENVTSTKIKPPSNP
ncbi:RHS repeat-associated core domain-containing protein [Chryseobacterium aahli]|uniref:DUF6443 domain-containing protein n=1 Tax=Chryseobacterium aahli TaxID=1278643 RepID=UPI001F608E87|nr:DUF6443 domain-containing protein [Chryseobacterium aahli]MCI3937395.1 RHS repeat-associated core domain-containing protein [Chryseobacterium aahli]